MEERRIMNYLVRFPKSKKKGRKSSIVELETASNPILLSASIDSTTQHAISFDLTTWRRRLLVDRYYWVQLWLRKIDFAQNLPLLSLGALASSPNYACSTGNTRRCDVWRRASGADHLQQVLAIAEAFKRKMCGDDSKGTRCDGMSTRLVKPWLWNETCVVKRIR